MSIVTTGVPYTLVRYRTRRTRRVSRPIRYSVIRLAHLRHSVSVCAPPARVRDRAISDAPATAIRRAVSEQTDIIPVRSSFPEGPHGSCG